jgi:hypothetical protein
MHLFVCITTHIFLAHCSLCSCLRGVYLYPYLPFRLTSISPRILIPSTPYGGRICSTRAPPLSSITFALRECALAALARQRRSPLPIAHLHSSSHNLPLERMHKDTDLRLRLYTEHIRIPLNLTHTHNLAHWPLTPLALFLPPPFDSLRFSPPWPLALHSHLTFTRLV